MKIFLRRTAALGDVVLATPVLQRLHRENPGAQLGVLTAYPAVFRDWSFPLEFGGASVEDRIVELDMAYERQPSMHAVDAYMLAAFGDRGDPAEKQQVLVFNRQPMFTHTAARPNRYVAVHAARAGWRNRTLPSATWREVVRLLRLEGYAPILVGTERDRLDGVTCASCFVPDIQAQARLISNCCAFIGSDSGLLHVAGATQTPIVGVFTSVRPEYRLPYRAGCVAVQPDLPCIGCQERVAAPATIENCERGDTACVGMVSADSIIAALVGLLGGQQNTLAVAR